MATTITSGTFNIRDTINLLGTVNINTSGTATTSIGNASSALTLVSSSLSLAGTVNVNATAGAGTTTIGNTSNTLALNGSTINITGTTNNMTGTTNINSTGSASTTIGNASATSTSIRGSTISLGTGASTTTLNIGHSALPNTNISGSAVNINTAGGTTNIGQASTGTVNILGTVNLNTSGTGTTNIGVASTGTINLLGAVNINTSGSGNTTIGNASSAFTISSSVVSFPNLTATTALTLDGSKNIASVAYASAKTASSLVYRDSNADFIARTITMNNFKTTFVELTNTSNQAVSGSTWTQILFPTQSSSTSINDSEITVGSSTVSSAATGLYLMTFDFYTSGSFPSPGPFLQMATAANTNIILFSTPAINNGAGANGYSWSGIVEMTASLVYGIFMFSAGGGVTINGATQPVLFRISRIKASNA
jgi:hypothetical protein